MAEFLFALAVALGWVKIPAKDPILYQPKVEPEADRFTRLLRQSI